MIESNDEDAFWTDVKTNLRKAKKIARQRGTSVSRIFSDYISEADDDPQLEDLGEITASMIGALRGVEIEDAREEYRNHLEKKYL